MHEVGRDSVEPAGGFETRPYDNDCMRRLHAVGRDSVEPLRLSPSCIRLPHVVGRDSVEPFALPGRAWERGVTWAEPGSEGFGAVEGFGAHAQWKKNDSVKP
jgi:hypothetical protein